jgi:hypothetical protein
MHAGGIREAFQKDRHLNDSSLNVGGLGMTSFIPKQPSKLGPGKGRISGTVSMPGSPILGRRGLDLGAEKDIWAGMVFPHILLHSKTLIGSAADSAASMRRVRPPGNPPAYSKGLWSC